VGDAAPVSAPPSIDRNDDVALRAALERAGVRFAPGGSSLVRITSCDPVDGCPDVMVLSGLDGAGRLVIERASMRPLDGQEHDWSFDVIDQATTLCDRAEHALGSPVSLELAQDARALACTQAARVAPMPAYLPAPYRLVSILSRDEGPIAPLAVDALALALEKDAEGGVLRVFARAYRRTSDARSTSDAPRPSLVAATRRAAEVALDATEPLGEARALRTSVVQRCVELDAIDVTRLPGSSLGRALRARRELVADPQRWLDRARAATGAALDVLRSTIGTIPEDVIADLVAVRAPEDRRRREEELTRFGREALAACQEDRQRIDALARGTLPERMHESAEQLRTRLADLRPIGLDVRPAPYGSSLSTLAMAAEQLARSEDAEERRKRAHDAIVALGPRGVTSPARQGLVRGLLSLFDRLATAKGEIADAMSLALLRLRVCACEAGARLVDEGILEQPDDALYLSVAEIEEALRGEAVAFASRARARREEDARFRNLRPPRRLAARGW
jgi:hypothetical protein